MTTTPQRRKRSRAARTLTCTLALAAPGLLSGCRATDTSPLAVEPRHEGVHGRHLGGSVHFGEARRADEGTWGADFVGLDILHLVELRWSRATRAGRPPLTSHAEPGGLGNY